MGAVMPAMPLVAGEFGREDCTDTDVKDFLDFLDGYGAGASYLAWVWTTTSPSDGTSCGSKKFDLITDYYSGDPTTVGAAIRRHYQGL
jgi:hypothetical protein